MLFNVCSYSDRFDIFKIVKAGSLAPIQELATPEAVASFRLEPLTTRGPRPGRSLPLRNA
jgi:hypothetical protein